MRIVYTNSNSKCHVINNGTMTDVETDFFDGKCDTFIEGYRFIPSGEKQDNITGTYRQFIVNGKNGKPTTKAIPYEKEATF